MMTTIMKIYLNLYYVIISKSIKTPLVILKVPHLLGTFAIKRMVFLALATRVKILNTKFTLYKIESLHQVDTL